MANAYECDRCGKLYKMYHDKKWLIRGLAMK